MEPARSFKSIFTFTDFTNNFEIGILNGQCIDYLNSNEHIIIGDDTWCDGNFTGHSLFYNSDDSKIYIRSKNTTYEQTLSTSITDSITITMAANYEYDTFTYKTRFVSKVSANLV